MAEDETNSDGKFSKISRGINLLMFRTQRLVDETNLKLDKDAVAARELLQDLAPHIGFLTNPVNSPKILEITTPTRQFVSIRRVEASELEHRFIKIVEPEDHDPFETVFKAVISPDSLYEGQILIFDTPSTIDLRCKKPQVEKEILDVLGTRIDDFCNFTWLAMMSDHPELFNPDDWQPSSMTVRLITKLGGKLFFANVTQSEGRTDTYEIYNFGKIKSEKNFQPEIIIAGYFQSETGLEANTDYLRKWGRVYFLTEGSSEKSQDKLTKLTPALSHSTA